jgi:uncharacterized protein YuzE
MTRHRPEAGYLNLRHHTPIARTVAIDAGLNVDLDAHDRIVGIERIGGAVETATLYEVLRAVTWTRKEPRDG